jgi:DNA-binding MarR family transcriptional regulator
VTKKTSEAATPPPVSNLETHAGYWLRMVSNHVSHAFKLKVEAQGVTVAEWVVLRRLFDLGEVHPSQLSESLDMTRGAISKLIDRLLAKGHVIRRADGADRRFQTVKLAATGRRLVPVLAALADTNDAELFGHLRAGELAALMGALKEIVHRKQLKSVPVE